MPDLVVDASVAGGWFIADEASPYTDATLAIVATTGALAPSLWPYEIANMLIVAERRGRATADEISEALRLFGALSVDIDPRHAMGTLAAVTRVAREFGLTAYDACYLELAMRTRSSLATRDVALERAAGRAGVLLFSG